MRQVIRRQEKQNRRLYCTSETKRVEDELCERKQTHHLF